MEDVVARASAELLVGAIVVLVLASALGGLVLRIVRHQSMRGLARTQGWTWLGRSTDFARLVARAFPELTDRAERSARRSAMQGNRHRSNGERVAGLAISLSGVGSRVDARVRGSHVAVAALAMGEATVGEVRVSARARNVGIGRRSGGNQQRTSSEHGSAAVARLPGSLPTVRLTRRSLLGRLFGGGDDGLPEDLAKKFDVEELAPDARGALIDSGAYRPLLADAVDGVTIADGHVAVMSRKRISRARAQALVGTLEELVAAMPGSAWHDPVDDPRLRAPVTE